MLLRELVNMNNGSDGNTLGTGHIVDGILIGDLVLSEELRILACHAI